MQRLSRKQSQERTRERLRQSALRVFARHGVAGAGIEQIVQEAGFTRGAFYANYNSKPELLIDLLREKQVREVRAWNDMFENAGDPDECLALVVAQSEDLVRTLEHNMLSVELQLEAERNDAFRPHFLAYLDTIYGEMRRLFVTILHRNGKAPPPNLESFVVIAYLFGLNLGSQTVLGNNIAKHATAGGLMIDFLKDMIASAPPLPPECLSPEFLPQEPLSQMPAKPRSKPRKPSRS